MLLSLHSILSSLHSMLSSLQKVSVACCLTVAASRSMVCLDPTYCHFAQAAGNVESRNSSLFRDECQCLVRCNSLARQRQDKWLRDFIIGH